MSPLSWSAVAPNRAAAGAPTVAEITVAGPMGPMLRAAFADRHIVTKPSCTVLLTGPRTGTDLTDLLGAFVERGLVIQEVHRLNGAPRRRSQVSDDPLGTPAVVDCPRSPTDT